MWTIRRDVVRCAMGMIVGVCMCTVGPDSAHAQCEPDWRPFDPSTAKYPGVDGDVFAMTMWDPDGAGPIGPRLVVGGQFFTAGNAVARNIAVMDPFDGQWAPLGTGVQGAHVLAGVYALAALPTGDLIAGGLFSTAGGANASNIARWDHAASAWSPMGVGTDGAVTALAALPNGELVAGGTFSNAGAVPAHSIARWDPATQAWSPMGSGMDGSIYALTVGPQGDLIAGGGFTMAGGVAASRIARWEGSTQTWSPFGAGMDGDVRAIVAFSNGDIVAGGFFASAGGVDASAIARWESASGTWAPLGKGLTGWNPRVYAVATLPGSGGGGEGSNLVAGGVFEEAGGAVADGIASWDSKTSEWKPLGTGMNNSVFSITALPGGEVVAGGWFDTAGGVRASSIAIWEGSVGSWAPLGTGVDAFVSAIGTPNDRSGDLIIGGGFGSVGGVDAERVARWSNATHAWVPMGSGMSDGTSGSAIKSLLALADGGVVAGGNFTKAGGSPANFIAQWDDASEAWVPMGAGMNDIVLALAAMPQGNVVAGGWFTTAGGIPANRVARWESASGAWSPMGQGMDGRVNCLAALQSGDVVAGGTFTAAGGVDASRIARWDSAIGAWAPLSLGVNGDVQSLAVLQSGDLVAGGSFTKAGGPGGVAANRIARWNVATEVWEALGSGITGDFPVVYALAVLPSGDLVAGGSFEMAGGTSAMSIARWDQGLGSWFPVGAGMNRNVLSLAVHVSGDLVAGGDFSSSAQTVIPNLARWSCPPHPPCKADCDGSNTLTIDDFICFQTRFVLDDPAADCDGSGALGIDDFVCFQASFALGC